MITARPRPGVPPTTWANMLGEEVSKSRRIVTSILSHKVMSPYPGELNQTSAARIFLSMFALLSYLLLRERLDAWQVVGAALDLCGVILISLPERLRSQGYVLPGEEESV